MEITLTQQWRDAGEGLKVDVFRGDDQPKLVKQASDRYRQLIRDVCQDHGIDRDDPRISQGLVAHGRWIDVEATANPFDQDWMDGYIEWRYRESGDEFTIRVIGPDNPGNPVVTVVEVG